MVFKQKILIEKTRLNESLRDNFFELGLCPKPQDIFRRDLILFLWYTCIPMNYIEVFMSTQTAVRLPDETFHRLQTLSKTTGRTTAYYIREALETHLEDLEDVYLSELAIENLKKGKDKILDSEAFWNGMEN